MNSMKKAFTMIEVVFVIVILGILAAVAIPKLTATRTDAQITKGISDVSSIRSAIVSERQSRLLTGDSSYITSLDDYTNTDKLFDTNGSSMLLMYGITPEDADGHWIKGDSDNEYKFKLEGDYNIFTYDPDNGTFICDPGTYCDKLNP
jgi:general secretion pathway protein G